MYKTIIIRRPIIIIRLFHLSGALHTHAQMRIKVKVYFGHPHYVIFVIKTARGQPRIPSMCRQLIETARTVRTTAHAKGERWDSTSQVGGPVHVSSSSVRTLLRLSILWHLRETERNAESEVYSGLRLLLLIGNFLNMDSKAEPSSKSNCRVIIFIYKLVYVKSTKGDIV